MFHDSKIYDPRVITITFPAIFRLWCGPALESPLRTVSGWLAEFDVNAWGRHDGLSPSEARLGKKLDPGGVGGVAELLWLVVTGT